jgi:hypothetical protein
VKWSVSASRIFKQCPRKWYFHEIQSNGKSKDKLQEEACFLKKLQTIPAWRGSLVDKVISNYVVLKLNRKYEIDEEELVQHALKLADQQIAFATSQKCDNGSNNDDVQCALYDIEYNGGIDAEELENAKFEIVQALRNFVRSKFLREFLQDGSYLISQRTIRHTQDRITVACTPDLIAFYENNPPLIVDWKVQALAHTEHWIQLAVYGLTISKIKPHKDFPEKWHSILANSTKIRLLEFQLLQNHERIYSMTPSDVIETEDYIYTSSNRMIQLTKGRKYPELLPEFVPTTQRPTLCGWCQFKKICWEKDET